MIEYHITRSKHLVIYVENRGFSRVYWAPRPLTPEEADAIDRFGITPRCLQYDRAQIGELTIPLESAGPDDTIPDQPPVHYVDGQPWLDEVPL